MAKEEAETSSDAPCGLDMHESCGGMREILEVYCMACPFYDPDLECDEDD